MPELSGSQARLLAWWSYGIVVTGSCGRSTVATFLGLLCEEKVANVEQRLYEWCLDAADKSGGQRRELDLAVCQVSLLRWILRLWVGQQLALTLDATNLGDRFVVLVVSVVYRSIGIPVAWTVLPAMAKGAWRDEFCRLLGLLQPAVPADWLVIVMADRGLSSSGLYQQIKQLQWHPFLRINSTAKFQPGGKQHHWYWLLDLLRPAGQPLRRQWQGCGRCFKEKASCIDCTLLAWWGEPYDEPWFVLTDLAPATCAVTWYGLRNWCEQGFKCNKRGAWQWQLTRMYHPQRAARLWLALAVATFWTVAVASELEAGTSLQDPDQPDWQALLDLAATLAPAQPDRPARRIRPLRLLRLGRLWLLVQALAHRPLACPSLLQPEPWPAPPPKSKKTRRAHSPIVADVNL
jgi:hypothetical protein